LSRQKIRKLKNKIIKSVEGTDLVVSKVLLRDMKDKSKKNMREKVDKTLELIKNLEDKCKKLKKQLEDIDAD